MYNISVVKAIFICPVVFYFLTKEAGCFSTQDTLSQKSIHEVSKDGFANYRLIFHSY